MRFTIAPDGPFSLAASALFIGGFVPAAHQDAGQAGHLHFAFVADGGNAPAGVCLRDDGGVVHGEVFGEADPAAVRRQTERILSLDVDASGYAAVGERDRVAGALQARYPGFRPVLFFSPYEAGAWVLISHRMRVAQAASLKARLAAEIGSVVDIHGDCRAAFPGPERLQQLTAFPGLTAQKLERLRALAGATAEGRLDATRLRALPTVDALAELQQLPGIGPFSAALILLRGAGAPDVFAGDEPRIPAAMARAYNLSGPSGEPSPELLRSIAEGWRPYRTWVSVLLRRTADCASGGSAEAGAMSAALIAQLAERVTPR